MPEKVEKICLWIIRLSTMAILFLPLLVYRPVLYPYIFSKIIVFQILVEIIFVAWLFLALYAKKKYQLNWRNPLVIALTVFMGILVLTAFTGVDIYKSFWSSQERMTGMITIVHFYLFFLVLTSVFRNKKNWCQFIWLSLICSFLVGLYGLGQKFGFEFLLKEGGVRMSATLGNPIFLAVYAMLHVFLAGFLLFYARRRAWRGILIFLLIFNLGVMFLTGTRAAVVAFGFSALLFLVFLVFYKKSKVWLKILAAFLFLMVIGGGVFIYLNKAEPWMGKAPYFIRRLTTISLESNKSRLTSWQIGLQGFKKRPIFGWGWENYNVVFNKYYHPFYLGQGQRATWFDRSHNQVIDLLALTGIIGTLSYLSIFGALFWLLFKKIKRLGLKQKIPLVIIELMFLAYFIQNLFVFDTPAPLIIFYFSLGLVYFITKGDTNYELHANDTNKEKLEIRNLKLEINKRFPLPVLIFLVVIFLPWAMYKFNIEPFQQSRLGIRAIHTSKVDLKSGLYWYQKALAKPVFTNPEIRTYLAKTIAEEYQKIGPKTSETDLNVLAQGTEMAIAEYKKSVREHPLDARHWLYLGQLYNLGARYNKEYIQEAGKVLHKALELSPQRQQIYFELARVHVYLKEYDQAIELLKQAVILDPQVKESRQNLESVLKAIKEQEPELVKKTQQFLQELKQ